MQYLIKMIKNQNIKEIFFVKKKSLLIEGNFFLFNFF